MAPDQGAMTTLPCRVRDDYRREEHLTAKELSDSFGQAPAIVEPVTNRAIKPTSSNSDKASPGEGEVEQESPLNSSAVGFAYALRESLRPSI